MYKKYQKDGIVLGNQMSPNSR